jgi:hypothetical protein
MFYKIMKQNVSERPIIRVHIYLYFNFTVFTKYVWIMHVHYMQSWQVSDV